MSCYLCSRLPGLMLALLLSLASAAPGWLHAAPAIPDAALAAFVEAGGAAQDICSSTPRHGADHGHADCGLCRVSGTDGLPQTSELSLVRLPAGRVIAVKADDIDRGHLRRHPAWSGRAPPVG